MNEQAIKAYHAATALGRRIPQAESSTSPVVDLYPARREANSAVLFATADTSSLIGCGYALSFANAAMFCPPSNYLHAGFDVVMIDGISTGLVLYSTAGMFNPHKFVTQTPAVGRPVSQSTAVTQSHQAALISAIRGIFPNARISVSSHSDEEEGWTRPLIEVDTGITDPDVLSALEYRFYHHVDNHETLKAALGATTILFE